MSDGYAQAHERLRDAFGRVREAERLAFGGRGRSPSEIERAQDAYARALVALDQAQRDLDLAAGRRRRWADSSTYFAFRSFCSTSEARRSKA